MSDTVTAAPAPETPPMPPAKNSPGAIWSLVLGILSIVGCLSFLTGIPAIIVGALSLKKISAFPRDLKGKGMAITGICTGAVGTLIAPVVLAIALPAILHSKDRATQALMISEMKMISNACQIYAIDNNNQFPEDLGKLFPVYLADASILTWTDPDSGAELPYIYFSGANPDSAESVPLLISPTDFMGERVIYYNSGTFEKAPAEAVETLLPTRRAR